MPCFISTGKRRIPRSIDELMKWLAGSKPDTEMAQALLGGKFEMADLMGRKLEKIESPATTPLIYESAPTDGKRWVLYVDGTVKQVREETFARQREVW